MPKPKHTLTDWILPAVVAVLVAAIAWVGSELIALGKAVAVLQQQVKHIQDTHMEDK